LITQDPRLVAFGNGVVVALDHLAAPSAIGQDKIRDFLANNEALKKKFDFFLEDTLRNAPHTLGAEAEGLLASNGILLQQPNNVYQQIADAELPRAGVTLSSGKKIRLDDSAYEASRTTANRGDRKLIFDAFFGAWKKFRGTLGANLTAQVIGDVVSARSRRFEDSLQGALFADNMPPEVYRTLIEQTNVALPTLHRYLRLRKEILGITAAGAAEERAQLQGGRRREHRAHCSDSPR